MTRAKPLPPDERRASLIAATRQLILDQGPDVTTRQVAEAAGVAEGTLFRAFATHRELIVATILDQLSPERLQGLLDATPATDSLDAAAELCLVTAADYVITLGRLIPRPGGDGPPGDLKHQIHDNWQARIQDVVAWMCRRISDYDAQLTIPVRDFVHVLLTLAMGYAHNRCPDIQQTPHTLSRLALDGARRKEPK